MWKSVTYMMMMMMMMMMTSCSLPSLQVCCLITPKLNLAGMYFQLPCIATFNFLILYCVDPKFVEQQQYNMAILITLHYFDHSNNAGNRHHNHKRDRIADEDRPKNATFTCTDQKQWYMGNLLLSEMGIRKLKVVIDVHVFQVLQLFRTWLL